MPNEIERVEPTSPIAAIANLMQQADGKFDVSQLKEFLDCQERWEANQAKKAYASDFALVQSKIAAVVKTKLNPQTRSNYAGLEDVLEAAKPVYTEHGFSIIYYEGVTEVVDNMRLCADVLHKAGHKGTYHLDVPLGGKGIQGKVNMIAIHAKATSVSYGRRYLLCMIFNIPTQDDDGNTENEKPEIRKPDADEQEVIQAICDKLPPKDGMIVDPDRLARRFWAQKQAYPANMKRVDAIAEAVAKTDWDIYVPDNRSEFEKTYDIPPDDDSQPDTPKELRYYCNNCDRESDKIAKKKNASSPPKCAYCFSENLIDRKAN